MCPLWSLTHPQGLEHSRHSINAYEIAMSYPIGINWKDFKKIEHFLRSCPKKQLPVKTTFIGKCVSTTSEPSCNLSRNRWGFLSSPAFSATRVLFPSTTFPSLLLRPVRKSSGYGVGVGGGGMDCEGREGSRPAGGVWPKNFGKGQEDRARRSSGQAAKSPSTSHLCHLTSEPTL